MSHVFKNTHARDSQGYTSWLLKNETKNHQNRGRNLPENTQRIRLRKRKGKVQGDHVHEDTYPTSYTVFGKLKDEFPQKYQKTVWSPSVSCTVLVTFQKLLDAQVRCKNLNL